jgi:O-antigen ligase
MFLDQPILGVGQGNFPYVFRDYEVAAGNYEGLHGRSRAGMAAHSIYFTLLPELGIVGTLIFAGMLYHLNKDLGYIRRLNFRKPTGTVNNEIQDMFYLGLAMQGSLIGFLVSGLFISILYYPNFWVLMGFIVALKKIALLADSHEQGLPKFTQRAKRAL